MKKYRVFISQINQQYYDVEANGETSAIAKAEKAWSKENGPNVMSVAKRD